MRHFLHVVCVTMASFADGYSNHKSNQSALVATSFLNSGKYSVNPEMRARMIASVTQKTSMEFCKAFWNITEHYGFQVHSGTWLKPEVIGWVNFTIPHSSSMANQSPYGLAPTLSVTCCGVFSNHSYQVTHQPSRPLQLQPLEMVILSTQLFYLGSIMSWLTL